MKMRNKFVYSVICASALVGLAACGNGGTSNSSDTASSGSDTLVIYSPNSEGLINATIPAFEERYGIKVDLIQAGTGELFKK
ncbi:iron ABC transporter substrate-binding protein, partial [Enterococcus faecalis]|nr:iron ABC transporter substrate-binding protein [Enterococcus faecalis]